MRYIILLLAIVLLVYIVRTLARSPKRSKKVAEKRRARVGSMVRCEQCGLHVPESEAVYRHGKAFCSREHADDWELEH